MAFVTVGNRFCFSEHFLPTDFKRTLTEEIKMEEIMMENGRLLQELQELNPKKRISKFGLERFSSSNEERQFYTGFPDYVTSSEFWKYVEPNAPKLTYFSFVRDNTDSVNFEYKFPLMAGKEKVYWTQFWLRQEFATD